MAKHHTYKPGDKVSIINQNMGGKFMIEGIAKIVRAIPNSPDVYNVKFDDGSVVQRSVNPAIQSDPSAYVRDLNASFSTSS